MHDPIVVPVRSARAEGQHPIAATGQSFAVHEWSGSGPDYLHVHHADDEAWHILEGTLTFRFSDLTVVATAGTTVFVPAGVAHSYYEAAGPTRYLIILTPRLNALIGALHGAPREEHSAIMRQFASEIVGVFQDHTTLEDTSWGTREFAFYDPDGNGLTFYRDL